MVHWQNHKLKALKKLWERLATQAEQNGLFATLCRTHSRGETKGGWWTPEAVPLMTSVMNIDNACKLSSLDGLQGVTVLVEAVELMGAARAGPAFAAQHPECWLSGDGQGPARSLWVKGPVEQRH